jgi:hypothetical protein
MLRIDIQIRITKHSVISEIDLHAVSVRIGKFINVTKMVYSGTFLETL